MTEPQEHQPSGGFLPPTPQSYQSPAASLPDTGAGSSSSDRFITELPHPRTRALRPGSNKEDMVRNYASAKLMRVARRYVKKFSASEDDAVAAGSGGADDEVSGYQSFAELCADLDAVINVLWLSGTPSLQIQILLRIASEITEYAPSFPAQPGPTLRLLRKLDHCFASLATGKDITTGEALPGFDRGLASGMTTTDMVRCRSTVENTRALMFKLLVVEVEDDGDGDGDDEGTEADYSGAETETDAGDAPPSTQADGCIDMDFDRIYENTLVCIGERLGGVM